MWRVRHQGRAVDRQRVLIGGNVDMADRVADLLLEDRFRPPGDAGLGESLHQEQRRLPMMDAGEDGFATLHLGAVDGFSQCFAPCFDEGRFQFFLCLARIMLFVARD